ncbi:MAG: hypothetical protein LH469_03975 [Frankiaceae bacterium]|nr:hypothetical protein [Frankiaceae bacterium]
MPVQDDVNAVRQAVTALKRAVDGLARHDADTNDVRRLRTDVSRLSEDVDLLCGTAVPRPAEPTQIAPREIIADTSYAHDFWIDAEDEGLGRADRR